MLKSMLHGFIVYCVLLWMCEIFDMRFVRPPPFFPRIVGKPWSPACQPISSPERSHSIFVLWFQVSHCSSIIVEFNKLIFSRIRRHHTKTCTSPSISRVSSPSDIHNLLKWPDILLLTVESRPSTKVWHQTLLRTSSAFFQLNADYFTCAPEHPATHVKRGPALLVMA